MHVIFLFDFSVITFCHLRWKEKNIIHERKILSRKRQPTTLADATVGAKQRKSIQSFPSITQPSSTLPVTGANDDVEHVKAAQNMEQVASITQVPPGTQAAQVTQHSNTIPDSGSQVDDGEKSKLLMREYIGADLDKLVSEQTFVIDMFQPLQWS